MNAALPAVQATGNYEFLNTDAFDWLGRAEPESIHAVAPDT